MQARLPLPSFHGLPLVQPVFVSVGARMYLLYLDESGNDPKLPWFILAGVSVPERQTHWIEQDLNEIATRFDGEDPHAVELHGNPMHKGNGRWR